MRGQAEYTPLKNGGRTQVNEKGQIANVVLVVALLAILAMNGFLIYKSLAPTAPQPYVLKETTSSPQENTKQKIITVSGTGQAAAKPNIAAIYLGVRTQAETATKAQSDNAALMNAVFDALKKNGISDSDIETTSYTLEPLMTYPEKETPRIVGYVCQNNIAVTVKDISRAGETIDIAVEAGANQVNSITFRLSDDKAVELFEQALKNAVADANKKAEAISKSLNVKIVGPLDVSLGAGYAPYPAMFESAVKAGTPIVPGELKVTVSVQVSYQYQ